ncbi:MAG: class F sortase [Dehalococcoidia bacterium]
MLAAAAFLAAHPSSPLRAGPFSGGLATSGDPIGPLPSFVPPIDESRLIYGGDGSEGAILRGQGIVRTSGAERRTNWELIIPSARLRGDIVRVSTAITGAFGAPDNPYVVGWWEQGPAPGQAGNVLLDGHRDFTDISGNVGFGVCILVDNIERGDFLIIRDRVTREHFIYRVREAVSIAWDDADGARYLQPSVAPILTLVTCEGSFDRGAHNYSQRRVVVAELTDTLGNVVEAAGSVNAAPPPIRVPLRQGWNLVGWTRSDSVSPSTLGFVQQVEALYRWDAVRERFESFVYGALPLLNTVDELRLGDGVWLRVGAGSDAVVPLPWHRQERWAPLQKLNSDHSGFNLVAWTGPNGTPVGVAVANLGDALISLFTWDAEAQAFRSYAPGRPSFLNTAKVLNHGEALWIQVSRATAWRQPAP